jgi:hypothetical protein
MLKQLMPPVMVYSRSVALAEVKESISEAGH